MSGNTVKAELQAIDRLLVYGRAFYEAAAEFLNQNNVPKDYLRWIYEYMKTAKKVNNKRNYYYSIALKPELCELYKSGQERLAQKNDYYKKMITCPACTAVFDEYAHALCPQCRLKCDKFGDRETILLHRKISLMTEREKEVMDAEIMEVYKTHRFPAHNLITEIYLKHTAHYITPPASVSESQAGGG